MKYFDIDIEFIDTSKIKIIVVTILSIYIYFYLNKISNKDEKISVIIPTFNRGHLILQSVNSVLNQTYQNIEVLIIDDGSHDNTEFLIKKLNNNKIKYIKFKKNRGACYARNIGILHASGKYISFQDSDDLYHQEKLEKQYNNLIKEKADFDFCKICLYINESQKIIFPTKNQEKNLEIKQYEKELCNGNYISTQSILVKKSYIKKYLFDTKFSRLQDYDLVLRMVPNLKVSYTNEILVDLYRQKDSIGISSEKYIKSLEILLKKKYAIKCNIENIYNKLKKNLE